MPSYKVAHIHEQGQDMLLFPLDDRFHHKTDQDKSSVVDELERRAHAAGLAGSAAVFWRHGGRTHFMGPRPWHGFLRSLDLGSVTRSVNREISWT